jgi:hypothetical protein
LGWAERTPVEDPGDEASRQVEPVVEEPVRERGQHGIAAVHADQCECAGEACLDHAEPAGRERELPEERCRRVGDEH